jgi:hypothetical protein
MASCVEQLQLLREAGLGQAQAEAILLVVEQKHEELAMKEDINQLRQWSLVTFSTQAQLAEVKVDLIKWITGMGLSAIGIGLARVYFMLAHFKP